MAKPKRPRIPQTRKIQEEDDGDSDSQAVVPSSRDTSSKYYHDEVDTFHETNTANLLAAGVQLQSDDDFTSDNEEVMALDVEGDNDDDDSESSESDLEEDLPGEPPSGLNKKLYRAVARHKTVNQDEDDGEDQDQESMASDLEERLHDEMPNELAWGQRKKMYYDTDYAAGDRKKGMSQEEDEAEANEEEAEAQLVQKRLVGNLDEDDFGLDFLQAFPQKAKPVGQKIEKDLKKMSEKEKLKLLKKESPELLELLKDLRDKLNELEEKLNPLMQKVKDGVIRRRKWRCYIETKNQLYLNYCTNISFYLVLKAKRIPVHGHPVIERLVSYRNLINELEVVDQRLSSELDLLLQKGKKKVRVSVKEKTPVENLPSSQLQKKNKMSKKAIFDVACKVQVDDSDFDDEAALQYYRDIENVVQRKRKRAIEPIQEHEADVEDFNPDAKRAITYQIAKNKGLTPKRKKIDRNPRVKHRLKYRRAKIRRKGQVREVRKEERRYSGELSGIRAGIKKSIKLK